MQGIFFADICGLSNILESVFAFQMDSILRILFFIFIVAFVRYNAFSQELERPIKTDSVKYWHFSGITNVNFNQMQFSNWAAGGENNISIAILGNYGAYFAKNRWKWDNLAEFGFGLIKPEDQNVRKNEDRWSLVTKAGYRLRKNLYFSARGELRSQFTEGYNAPPNDTVRISNFFAPAYSLVSLGLEYKPLPELAIGAYPVTNKITYVMDNFLSQKGAFGVKKGEKTRIEALGALVSVFYKKQFGKSLAVQSRLELFNNYTDEDIANRKNIDVNWETTLNLKVTKYIATTFFFHVLYDQNTPVPLFRKENGVRIPIGSGPRTQIKQVLGIAFSYQFDTRPKK